MYGTASFGRKEWTVNFKKSKIRDTEMWEVIKIKHISVIPGDKYIPHHSAS
jgi:hypothetical protein